MVKRLSWLTGVAAIGLSLLRLERLLQPQESGPGWPLVLGAAAILGATFTWVALSYRLTPAIVAAVNAAGMAVAVLRITAPDTLVLGFLPTSATPPVLRTELTFASEIIRFGAAPVLPVAGLVAVLAIVYWTIGSVAAAGVVTRRPALITVPALAFYLQLATLDRRSPGGGWLAAFAIVAGLAVLSMASSGNPAAGKVRSKSRGMLPRVSGTTAVVVAVAATSLSLFAADALASAVPEAGTLQWRTRTGIGSGLYGGSSYNLFASMQQSLRSPTDDIVFYATVSDNAPPNRDLYWRLITLDAFDGDYWLPSGDLTWAPGGSGEWERPDMKFQGNTTRVAALVQIAGMREQVLPTLSSPVSLTSDEPLISGGYWVREDGSIRIDVRTNEGWTYEFQSDIPRPDVDYLASAQGSLSPIFAEAAANGVFDGRAEAPVTASRPEDISTYLELPSETPTEIRTLSRTVTSEGTTPFERALLLESWFRDSRNFTYSTNVDTGHTSLDLAAWLLDPESPNYRVGYCEQFATAMGVMARSIGLPSRVVLGFTPGQVAKQSDGSDVIVVRDRNAHAWVELWMDGQGWVRFDPTPRSDDVNPALVTEVGFDLRNYIPAPEEIDSTGSPATPGQRPDLGPEILNLPGDATPDFTRTADTGIPRWVYVIPALVLLLGAVPAFKWNRRRRRLAAIRTGDVDAAWAEIVDRLTDLGETVPGYETPIEIATRHHADLVPLATMYSASAYGGKPRGDSRGAFSRADERLDERYAKSTRVMAWLRLGSLRRR